MRNTYFKAACLGIIAGMRSMSAPALVSSHFARTQSALLEESPLKLLGSPTTAVILKALALGEIIADKMPNIPARIAPGPLIARAASGGICGTSVCIAERKQPALGAIIGALAAIMSAFGFYHLRRRLGQDLHVADPWLAVAEDSLVVGLGRSIL